MKNKGSRARIQVIFGTLLFVLALLAELYVMINQPMQYHVIAVLAVAALGCVYIAVNGLLIMQKEREAESNEQKEFIFKSEKASFLMSRKNFEEIGNKLSLMENANMGTSSEEIVNTQKGIARAIINYNRKNTDTVMEQIKALAIQLDELSQAVAENQSAIGDNRDAVSENVVQEQDLIAGMKEMELRLNSAIAQIQEMAVQPPVAGAPEGVSLKEDASPVNEQPELDTVLADAALTEVMEELPEMKQMSEELPEAGSEPEAAEEPPTEPEAIAESEAVLPTEPEKAADPVEVKQPEPIEELPQAEAAPEPDVKPEQKELPPMPDLSDENKVLSLDEIDALFANMGVQMEAAQPEPEAVFKPDVIMDSDLLEEPKEIPKPEDKPAMPDLSDPNKAMSPDEIAALFASLT